MNAAKADKQAFRVDEARVRDLLFLLIAWGAFLLQSVIAQNPKLRFDLPALFILFLALELEFMAGLIMSVLVGYLADIYSGDPSGLTVTALVLVFLLLRLMVVQLRMTRPFLVLGLGFIASFADLFFKLLIESGVGPDQLTLIGVAPGLVSMAVGALLFSYPLYWGLRRIKHRFKTREDLGLKNAPSRSS